MTRGIVPGGGGTQTLPRRVGHAIAADLLLTGRKVEIDEAARLHLIDRRAPAGEAVTVAIALAEQIAGNSPVAVANAKGALKDGADLDLAEALDVEDRAWRATIVSPDRAEGVAAFVQKRPARFD